MPSATLTIPDSQPNLKELSDADLLTTFTTTRDARLKVSKLVALSEEREKQMQAEVLKRFPTSETKGNFVVSVSNVDEPSADDWPAILGYIKSTGSVDLLEKRLLKSGVKERWAEGTDIPGVSKVKKTTLKVEVI